MGANIRVSGCVGKYIAKGAGRRQKGGQRLDVMSENSPADTNESVAMATSTT